MISLFFFFIKDSFVLGGREVLIFSLTGQARILIECVCVCVYVCHCVCVCVAVLVVFFFVFFYNPKFSLYQHFIYIATRHSNNFFHKHCSSDSLVKSRLIAHVTLGYTSEKSILREHVFIWVKRLTCKRRARWLGA